MVDEINIRMGRGWHPNKEDGMPRGGKRPGQGRPNTLGETKQVAVRLSLDLIEKMNRKADEKGITMAELIRDLLEKTYG